jgi:hypothetical protein
VYTQERRLLLQMNIEVLRNNLEFLTDKRKPAEAGLYIQRFC